MAIEHVQSIAAAASRVWELTVDVERWPELMPTMQKVTVLDEPGRPFGVGSQARVKQPGQRATVWTVTQFDAPHRFTWTSAGRHPMTARHVIEAVDGGHCVNTLAIEADPSTLAARVRMAMMKPMIGWVLRRENRAFREEAERAAAPGSAVPEGAA